MNAISPNCSQRNGWTRHGAHARRRDGSDRTRQTDTATYAWNEQDLNALGYDLMGQPSGYRFPVVHRYDDAIAALALNTELFPNSANVWDSYGEALLTAGRRDQALAMYRRALAIDSTYATARRVVDSLTAPLPPTPRGNSRADRS